MRTYFPLAVIYLTLSAIGWNTQAREIYQLQDTSYNIDTDTRYGLENTGIPAEFNKPVVYANKLYVVTKEGGSHNDGAIAEYNTATGAYTKKADLHIIGARNCSAGMVVLNDKLYGVTGGGGLNNQGVLFEFNPKTNALTSKHDFTFATGSGCSGDLIVISNKLYGITTGGGQHGDGVIFEFNPATSRYKKKIDLVDSITGSLTRGGLTSYDNLLWGVTTFGTQSGGGGIFSYNPVTNTITPKVSLGSIGIGQHYGTLAYMKNNKFYGVASQGGATGEGAIFEYDPANNMIKKKIDFMSTTTNNRCLFTVCNGRLYSMSSSGELGGSGSVFSYDPSTNSYAKHVSLNRSTGTIGSGCLTMVNDKLYGFTLYKEGISKGALIEFDPETNSIVNLIDLQKTIQATRGKEVNRTIVD